jgi:hypothetical protein
MKTTTFNLKAAVEESIGAEICPAFFEKAERYARRKLDFINERAGRTYGEDGYGDEYLVILTEEMIGQLAFSEYTILRSMEIMAARAAQEGGADE